MQAVKIHKDINKFFFKLNHLIQQMQYKSIQENHRNKTYKRLEIQEFVNEVT